MIYAIIILAIALISTVIFAVNDEDHNGYCYGLFGGVVLSVLDVFIAEEISGPTPNPIDVYRGYTTLQITYEDSTAVDSAVVFKKEFRKEEQ